MPVLARTLEAAGLSTVMVTPMPFWAQRVGVPRTLAVEFPFGQLLGAAGNALQQRRIVEAALTLLETASSPGTLVHWPERWTRSQEQARQEWQPLQPSPIVAHMMTHLRQALYQSKQGRHASSRSRVRDPRQTREDSEA